MVELKEVMLGESKAQEKMHICVEVACTMSSTVVVMVLAKIRVHNMKVECDYTCCHNRDKVVGTKYTKPNVVEQVVPELEEVSARTVKMLTEMKVKVECMEDYTCCDNRAKIQPSTAMEVVRIKYTELEEVSTRAVNQLTEMWSMRESSLGEELSRKMVIIRRQDVLLPGIDATTVQISTANTQLKVNAYKKHAMVEMVVELQEQECSAMRVLL